LKDGEKHGQGTQTDDDGDVAAIFSEGVKKPVN
jgi:hypothetical protein